VGRLKGSPVGCDVGIRVGLEKGCVDGCLEGCPVGEFEYKYPMLLLLLLLLLERQACLKLSRYSFLTMEQVEELAFLAEDEGIVKHCLSSMSQEEQEEQLDAPDAEKKPPTHGVHCAEPKREKVPAGQRVQAFAPTSAYLPAAQ
jgi:hypothetical protein